jgi:hypothetical protein
VSGLKLTLTSNPRIPTGHGALTGLTAAQALTHFGPAARTMAGAVGIAASAIRAAARQAEATANELRQYLADQIEPHAFTPDLDLACTHPRCTFTAEQH